MKNNFDELFDKNARDLFQNFKMDFDPAADWGKMEQQLSQRADEKFDQQAKNTFEGYEMEFNPADWERMERLLDRKRHRPTYFWLYKTLQLGLMSTVAAAAFWFFPFDFNNNKTNQGQPTEREVSANEEQNTLINPNQQLWAATDGQQVTAYQYNQSAAHGSKPQPANTNSNNSANTQRSNSTTTANSQQMASLGTAKTKKAKNKRGNQPNTAQSNNGQALDKNGNNLAQQATSNQPPNSNEQSPAEGKLIAADNATNVQFLPTLELLAQSAAQNTNVRPNTDPQTAFGLKKIKLKQPYMRQLKLALVASIETHSETSHGRGISSFMLGAQAEGDLNRYFAVAAGLQYARRNHELEQTSSLFSPDGQSYTQKERRQTHLSILQIPILLQTSVLRNEKWRVYINTGLNANLIFDKTYSGEIQISSPQSAGNARIQTNISNREYEGGYLQTGDFRPNAFFTLQAGLGVERQLSDRWSLYVQPNYQQSLNKFGSQSADRSRIISLNVGMKTSF